MLFLWLVLTAHADTGGCDLDGDGEDALFCGGSDCNDGDATVYPDAIDAPEDGIDQDCDGRDAGSATWVGSGGSPICGVQGAPGLGVLFLAAWIVRGRVR